MAKVCILTFHFSNNAGAMLQAYGLSQAIAGLGHEVEVVDYRPLSVRTFREGPLPRNPRKFLRAALRRWRIRSFRRAFLPLSRTYLTLEELRRDPPQADCFVCGSDQVWNTTSPVRGFDPAFFLEFLPESGPRRVSYAATFGNGEELGSNKQRICGLLSRFDQISLRDVKSQMMLRDLTGRSSVHVLDPSFLTDYGPITPPPPHQDSVHSGVLFPQDRARQTDGAGVAAGISNAGHFH